ncbi:hypothetical protein C8Q80DRAFT_234653 [Daedaleopsis nitida]|nr:hypothetical protein C8Q80DRAFT_234653 [Daedaleopsis nitida]
MHMCIPIPRSGLDPLGLTVSHSHTRRARFHVHVHHESRWRPCPPQRHNTDRIDIIEWWSLPGILEVQDENRQTAYDVGSGRHLARFCKRRSMLAAPTWGFRGSSCCPASTAGASVHMQWSPPRSAHGMCRRPRRCKMQGARCYASQRFVARTRRALDSSSASCIMHHGGLGSGTLTLDAMAGFAPRAASPMDLELAPVDIQYGGLGLNLAQASNDEDALGARCNVHPCVCPARLCICSLFIGSVAWPECPHAVSRLALLAWSLGTDAPPPHRATLAWLASLRPAAALSNVPPA